MKKILTTIIIFCLLISFSVCGANYKNWFEYEANSSRIVVTKILYAPGKFTFSGLNYEKEFWFNKGACRYNNVFEEIQLPSNLVQIGEEAFKGCKKLRTVKLTSTRPLVIKREAFSNCIALSSLTLPKTTEVVGEKAFDGCKSLQNVILRGNNLVLGKESFVNCKALVSADFNDNVYEIGEGAFKGCSSLKELKGMNNVRNIYSSAFGGCVSIENIILSDNTEIIGESAFRGCTTLNKAVVCGKIEKNAFHGCSGLEELYLLENTSELLEGAFSGCTSLKSVYASSSITKIADDAIPANNNLTIYGAKGSVVEEYANKKKIKFVDVSGYVENYISSLDLVEKNIPIRVLLDGRKLSFDVAPETIDDRTMVPMRTIFEKLGAEVTWLEDYQEIDAVKNNTRIKLKIGSNILYKNTVPIELDVAPVMKKDRTLVPIRAVAESFSCNVSWDEERKIIKITSKNEDGKATQPYPAMEVNPNVPDVGKANKLKLIRKGSGVYLYEKTADFEKTKSALYSNLVNYGFVNITDNNKTKFLGQFSEMKIYTNGVEKVAYGETQFGIIFIIF